MSGALPEGWGRRTCAPDALLRYGRVSEVAAHGLASRRVPVLSTAPLLAMGPSVWRELVYRPRCLTRMGVVSGPVACGAHVLTRRPCCAARAWPPSLVPAAACPHARLQTRSPCSVASRTASRATRRPRPRPLPAPAPGPRPRARPRRIRICHAASVGASLPTPHPAAVVLASCRAQSHVHVRGARGVCAASAAPWLGVTGQLRVCVHCGAWLTRGRLALPTRPGARPSSAKRRWPHYATCPCSRTRPCPSVR